MDKNVPRNAFTIYLNRLILKSVFGFSVPCDIVWLCLPLVGEGSCLVDFDQSWYDGFWIAHAHKKLRAFVSELVIQAAKGFKQEPQPERNLILHMIVCAEQKLQKTHDK